MTPILAWKPEKYEDGSYEYKCSINGNFYWFQGKEIISFCGKEVYECYFHGGLIKEKHSNTRFNLTLRTSRKCRLSRC